MKNRISISMIASAVVLMAASRAQAQSVTGQWQFNGSGNADTGTALTLNGTWGFTTDTIGGQTAQVATFTNGSYITVPHGISPNGGAFVNRYSILADIWFPTSTAFTSFYQTSGTPNGNDGDWFVRNDGGTGISGDYTDTGNTTRYTFGTWQRIGLVIDTTSAAGTDNTVYRSYINGILQNVVQTPSGWGLDGRFSLNPTFFLLADNDGETQSGRINSLQVRDYAMSAAEVAALGAPTALGIGAVATVAPEASAMALLAIGLLPLCVVVRRRNAR